VAPTPCRRIVRPLGMADGSMGERIAAYRRRRGMSQAALAGLVGRSESWLSQVERGLRSVDRLSVLLDMSRVLHVDVDSLICWPWGPRAQRQSRGRRPCRHPAVLRPVRPAPRRRRAHRQCTRFAGADRRRAPSLSGGRVPRCARRLAGLAPDSDPPGRGSLYRRTTPHRAEGRGHHHGDVEGCDRLG
jgi:transcriptional regulator with XRE-family HTH domain